MDLSFPRFDRDENATVLPQDLAVLMVGVAARQAASPTALAQARLPFGPVAIDRFAPVHGSFCHAVATLLTDAKDL